MKVWKYSSTVGGLEKHLKLLQSEPLPKPKTDQHLIQVIAASLNPVDYKPVEAPIVGRFTVNTPATPGIDFSGRIVKPAPGSHFKPGQLVLGTVYDQATAGGALAEYISADANKIVAIPSALSALQAAGIPIAASTAYGSLEPYIKQCSRVFINGGSGGVGTFAIQIAKALGAHVTISCSARNIDLCRSLGADEVLDYTARPLLHQLREAAAANGAFDHVVDNAFSDPALYFHAHSYTTPSAKFVEVGWGPSAACLRFILAAKLLPGFLGGGRRKMVVLMADTSCERLEKIGSLVSDGKVKVVVDSVFSMGEAPEAFQRLKSSRAVGKVIVDVAGEK